MVVHRRRLLLSQVISYQLHGPGSPVQLVFSPRFHQLKRNLQTQLVSAEHHSPRHSQDS